MIRWRISSRTIAAPELTDIFKKLDQLSAEPTTSNRSKKRANDTVQRAAGSQWYLARSELRAGRRENASRIFGELRGAHPQLSALAGGLFEFAQLELDNRRFDEALAILEDARALRPDPALIERINLLAGHAHYGARHFEAAAQTFEAVAHTSLHSAADSFFNASLAWLQLSDHARFLDDYRELGQGGGNEEARGDLLRGRYRPGCAGKKKRQRRCRVFCENFLVTGAAPKRGSL